MKQFYFFSALLISSVLFMPGVFQPPMIAPVGDVNPVENCLSGNLGRQCGDGYELVDGQCEPHKYKKIKIQSLDRKDQPQPGYISSEKLVESLDPQLNQTQKAKIYTYKDTGIQGSRISSNLNNFFMGFFSPYKTHGDLLLVPDDIWLNILIFFSSYIDDNAEKLRHQFVKHDGKKKLTIIRQPESEEESIKMEKQWDFFLEEIFQQIRENTLQGVVDSLKCDFSTTNEAYQLISTSILMASFKNYFKYEEDIILCGIQNVYFDGTREDWVKIGEKLKNLEKYDVDGKLVRYVKAVGNIITKFIETYDGNPDTEWWNNIITTDEVRNVCGYQDGTYVMGWILDFFGIQNWTHIKDIPKTSLKVPIKLVNSWTRTQKELEMLMNWVSVSKLNKYLYKPDIGMCIVERSQKSY